MINEEMRIGRREFLRPIGVGRYCLVDQTVELCCERQVFGSPTVRHSRFLKGTGRSEERNQFASIRRFADGEGCNGTIVRGADFQCGSRRMDSVFGHV